MTVYFDAKKLKERCFQPFFEFRALGESRKGKNGEHIFIDNGKSILAVAHLDTVAPLSKTFSRVMFDSGETIFCRHLDDRLGVYLLLDMVSKIPGIEYDILLTDGEEVHKSTGQDFDPPRQYNWMFSFDRGGKQTVLYQYECDDLVKLVKAAGGSIANGMGSDIRYMEHLGCKGINWATGYVDAHMEDTSCNPQTVCDMVNQFTVFYRKNKDTFMRHEKAPETKYASSGWWNKYDTESGYGYQMAPIPKIPPTDNHKWCDSCKAWAHRTNWSHGSWESAISKTCDICLDDKQKFTHVQCDLCHRWRPLGEISDDKLCAECEKWFVNFWAKADDAKKEAYLNGDIVPDYIKNKRKKHKKNKPSVEQIVPPKQLTSEVPSGNPEIEYY